MHNYTIIDITNPDIALSYYLFSGSITCDRIIVLNLQFCLRFQIQMDILHKDYVILKRPCQKHIQCIRCVKYNKVFSDTTILKGTKFKN